jgi:NAD(P)-dependent dehydrogenase (short-subunit alcohol dehydrogenase family)
MGTMAVTGAASGIGAACVRRLSAAGHDVVTVDLHDAAVRCDLASPEGRHHGVEAVLEKCQGRLDGLVTCAGLAGGPSRPGAVLASVNYFGTVELLEGLRPALAAADDAAAVAMSSHATTIQPALPLEVCQACLEGDEGRARELADAAGSLATYPATKMAVARWVRRHAVTEEWAGQGIRLNALAPGMTETAMVAEGRADPEVAPLLEMVPIPLGRTGRPEDLAALIEFLLGPHGAYLCGSIILVDGGTEALLRPDDWPAPWDLPRFRGAPR